MGAIVPDNMPQPPKEYTYTQKEADFCIHYAFNNNGTEAIKAAHYDISSDNSAGVLANTMLSNIKISTYISIIKQSLLSPNIINRAESLEILSKIARNTYYHGKDGDIITPSPNMNAIDIVNKMTGEYAPIKHAMLGRIVFDIEFVTGEPNEAADDAIMLE